MTTAPYQPDSPGALTAKWAGLAEGLPANLNLRMRRATSWLGRAQAEMAQSDPDAAFIFYWIAFNSAYAEDAGQWPATPERSSQADFFQKLIDLDRSRRIYDALWEKFSGPIRLLLDNEFVFQPFWNYHNGIPGNADWSWKFENGKARIREGLARLDTVLILTTLFDRLYVLRNQLIHGGATWQSSRNRTQVQDGSNIMAFMVPLFIDLMLENPRVDWGPPCYPVVGNQPP